MTEKKIFFPLDQKIQTTPESWGHIIGRKEDGQEKIKRASKSWAKLIPRLEVETEKENRSRTSANSGRIHSPVQFSGKKLDEYQFWHLPECSGSMR